MIDKNKLIKELLEECDKDIYKSIPIWILNTINRQVEIKNER